MIEMSAIVILVYVGLHYVVCSTTHGMYGKNIFCLKSQFIISVLYKSAMASNLLYSGGLQVHQVHIITIWIIFRTANYQSKLLQFRHKTKLV